ncbi:alpha/beta hydrolase [Glaciihabitans sp. dw_435]|uniref:alpha/beta hydrolase n=1 Tax=Glaciihabitans sp. dw_435 TaxID=2720081 RepID=UPI002106D104|nr:alpha/beta hydrolase [Glaciihabitans sp. dw_435]
MPFPTLAPSRVPVWVWRALMSRLAPGEAKRFNAEPVDDVEYTLDIDYVGDGIRAHRLDVLVPSPQSHPGGALPIYVYFHGGGWTSGDKAPLTKYCASQAASGMVVVNVNYRMATRFQMGHMLADANAALRWVVEHAAEFGGDASRIVLGGDSAGGQISALLAASLSHPELRQHYRLAPIPAPGVCGVVQHCSAVDFSVVFERGFVLGLGFVKILLPNRGVGTVLTTAARFLSPIEWLDPSFPPVLVTTSEQDYFYRANLNFIRALQRHGVRVETLIYGRSVRNARHTWQQDSRYPESQAVYRKLQAFVRSVTRVRQLQG